MEIRIKTNSCKNIDVFVGESMGTHKMALMATEQVKDSIHHKFKIQDVRGGEFGTPEHRKHIGTALVFYFLDYLNSEYGPDTIVCRDHIHHEHYDSLSTRQNRERFWSKFDLHNLNKSTVGHCLNELRKHKITVNKTQFILI